MSDIDCPRAKSAMTPCIARDGRSALADDLRCVGCNAEPLPLLDDLLAKMGGSDLVGLPRPEQQADLLAAYVRLYVDRKETPHDQTT